MIEGAGVSIGVSRHSDDRLTSCPAAARIAEEIAAAVGPCFSGGVTAVVDPKGSYELFLAIQTAIQKARGGTFVLHFAGLTIRRGDDLLLTTCGSSLAGKTESVPWSDVDAILEQEKIGSGLVILNAEGFAGVGWGGPASPRIHGMGSVRIHDPLVADRRIGDYGAAVADALTRPAWELREHLTDGRLDLPALGRYLLSRAPAPPREGPPPRGEAPRHETFGTPDAPEVVLRDLRDDLAKGPPARAVVAVGDDRAAPSSRSRAAPSPGSRAPLVLGAAAALALVCGVLYLLLGG